MKRIKITLGFLLLLLTGVAMLVTNFVILPFWVGDVIARETRHLQQLLVTMAAPSSLDDQRTLPLQLRVIIEESMGGCVSWREKISPGRPSKATCQQGLQSLVSAAAQTRSVRTSISETAAPLALLVSKYLYIAVPFSLPGRAFEAVGVGVPFAQIFRPLLNKERIIAAYLVFNGLILAMLAYFRLLKFYVQPIDRLVQAAESYKGGGLHAFVEEKTTNELGQLSGSIQAMVQRIEHDKGVLKETIEELATKNRQLQRNQREMVRAEKLASVGRLAAGLAHEIGNPLGVAQGYLQLLGMNVSQEHERADYIARALKELERVDGLIRQLLDYARTSTGKPERFDVHEMLSELVESLRLQPFLDGIRINLVLQAENTCIYADQEQLRQVLLNCLLNAADAVNVCKEKGGGVITLATAVTDPLMMQLAIQDNGVGINPELLDTVFDPFFTTKEPGSGTGLGLSVSLALIESMGGTIQLQSVAREGTTVLLSLPLAEDREVGDDASVRKYDDRYVEPSGEQIC